MEPKFLSYLPECLVREIEEGRAAVVGGAIRTHHEGRPPVDVDVFVFEKANHATLVAALGATPKPGTDGAVFELKDEVPIEIVCLSGWSSAIACVTRADFDIAGGVYCAGQLCLPDGYREAIQSKRMRFLGTTEDPQRSYARFLKYNRAYGYRIDDSIRMLLRLWKEVSG